MLKKLIPILLVTAAAFFMMPVMAQTPDGDTPADETVCDDQVGAAFGLCNAYCEAMDCDSDNPQATATACGNVLDNFLQQTGTLPPCENICPCFDLSFLQDLGDVIPGQCGDDFPFADVAAAFYTNGSIACSGQSCGASSPHNCGYFDSSTGQTFIIDPITEQEDLDCRSLIVANCPNPAAQETAAPAADSGNILD